MNPQMTPCSFSRLCVRQSLPLDCQIQRTYSALRLCLKMLCILALFPQCIHANDLAEPRAFRTEIEHTTKTNHPTLQQYKETLLKNLNREAFYTPQSEPTDLPPDPEPHPHSPPSDGTSEDIEPRRSNSLTSSSFNQMVLVFGILVLIAIVTLFIQKIHKNLIADAKSNIAQSTAENIPTTESDALEQAEQFETNHDFREAIRSLYLVALLHLQEHGFLSYDRSRTNREYLNELRENPNLQHALQPVIHTFDEIWYGYKPCTAETVTEYRELLPKVYEACN